MNKKLFTIFATLMLAENSIAQVQEDFNQQYSMPIFPGCEKLISSEEQFMCFQQNVTTSYTKHLESYLESFEYLNLPLGESKLSFIVDKNGELILKNIDTTQPLFRDYNVMAFQDFDDDLKNRSLKIIPAKEKQSGKAATIVLHFPVGFKLTRQVEEVAPRIISVLQGKDVTYELVVTPKHELKMYELSTYRPIYLGKYNSITEIKNTMPYQAHIAQMEELVTLAQSEFGKEKFILQSKNIFDADTFKTIFIVSKVKGKKIKQLRKYTTLEEFKNSPYYDWIIREDY